MDAAAVCVIPTDSRAVLTCSGVEFEEGPFGPRFGWMDTLLYQSEIQGTIWVKNGVINLRRPIKSKQVPATCVGVWHPPQDMDLAVASNAGIFCAKDGFDCGADF